MTGSIGNVFASGAAGAALLAGSNLTSPAEACGRTNYGATERIDLPSSSIAGAADSIRALRRGVADAAGVGGLKRGIAGTTASALNSAALVRGINESFGMQVFRPRCGEEYAAVNVLVDAAGLDSAMRGNAPIIVVDLGAAPGTKCPLLPAEFRLVTRPHSGPGSVLKELISVTPMRTSDAHNIRRARCFGVTQ